MMNKRPGVTARFAQGDELQYLRAVEAAASHMYLGDGESLILIRAEVATRGDVLHEWLHRRFALGDASLTVGEEHLRIESFLTGTSPAPSDRPRMTTVAKIKITRMIPLREREIIMVHAATGDINRDWLGPVKILCGPRRFRMRCVGVGETGREPALMLRPDVSEGRTFQEIIAVVSEHLPCSLAIERVPATGDRADTT